MITDEGKAQMMTAAKTRTDARLVLADMERARLIDDLHRGDLVTSSTLRRGDDLRTGVCVDWDEHRVRCVEVTQMGREADTGCETCGLLWSSAKMQAHPLDVEWRDIATVLPWTDTTMQRRCKRILRCVADSGMTLDPWDLRLLVHVKALTIEWKAGR